MIRMFLAAAIASACVVGCASIVAAQASYPEKPLQLIVPFPPGGASDVVGRIIAGELEARLGKPVIVLNRPGGGTTIAAREAANAAPDGYTLLSSSNSTFTLQHAVKENVPYDSAKDFEPIGQTGTLAMVLVTHRDNPIKDVAALVAAAKANPDKLSLASYGVATISHFAGELFKSSAGIKMVHLPYKGSAPAMNDLMGKHIEYHVDTVIAIRPLLEAGTVRPLAVFSAKRSSVTSRRSDARRTRLSQYRLCLLGYHGRAEGNPAGHSRPAGLGAGRGDRKPFGDRTLPEGRVRSRLQALSGLAGIHRQGNRRDEGTGPQGRDQGRVILT